MADRYLLEDGTSLLLLEDGTSYLLLEGTAETTFCDYDFADDTYDNATDTYDCGAVATDTAPNAGGYQRPRRYYPSAPDDDDEALILVAVLRHRFRL